LNYTSTLPYACVACINTSLLLLYLSTPFPGWLIATVSVCYVCIGGRPGSPSSGEDEPAPKKTKPDALLGNGPGAIPGPGGMMQGMMPPQGPMHPHSMAPMGQFGPPMGHPMMGHMGPPMGPPFMGPG